LPTRLVREGILSSKPVSNLSMGAELFFRKTMNVADDYGRFEADVEVLRASLYPRQLGKVSEQNVSDYLRECVKEKLIKLYRVGQKVYLQIEKFGQRPRAASRYPDPKGNWSKAPARNVRTCDSTVLTNDSNVRAHSDAYSDAYSDAKANAESETKSHDDSAAFLGFRNKQPAKSRAGTANAATAKPRPDGLRPGASPPRNGRVRKRPENGHSTEELAMFRRAVQRELGPEATEAEIEQKFAEYVEPRRPA
jgi:hypothetical protein